ncbi:MAG: zinc ribbon domain-containing protein [Planctomycetota bacterium]|jgi:hypothetical protein
MAKVEMQCPNCGGVVELGDIECVHCGVNLKSGETYETRIKQARGKGLHPEHFIGGIYTAVALGFGLVMFAGFMYQRSTEKVIRQKPGLFDYPVLKMQEIDDLVAFARHDAARGDDAEARYKYNQARKRMRELIEWITIEEQSIKAKQAYAPKTQTYGMRREKEFNRKGAKRLLRNLRAKARFKLEQIPGTVAPTSDTSEGAES